MPYDGRGPASPSGRDFGFSPDAPPTVSVRVPTRIRGFAKRPMTAGELVEVGLASGTGTGRFLKTFPGTSLVPRSTFPVVPYAEAALPSPQRPRVFPALVLAVAIPVCVLGAALWQNLPFETSRPEVKGSAAKQIQPQGHGTPLEPAAAPGNAVMSAGITATGSQEDVSGASDAKDAAHVAPLAGLPLDPRLAENPAGPALQPPASTRPPDTSPGPAAPATAKTSTALAPRGAAQGTPGALAALLPDVRSKTLRRETVGPDRPALVQKEPLRGLPAATTGLTALTVDKEAKPQSRPAAGAPLPVFKPPLTHADLIAMAGPPVPVLKSDMFERPKGVFGKIKAFFAFLGKGGRIPAVATADSDTPAELKLADR